MNTKLLIQLLREKAEEATIYAEDALRDMADAIEEVTAGPAPADGDPEAAPDGPKEWINKRPVIIGVGHSRPGDAGALSADGTTEWRWNKTVAHLLLHKLREAGVNCQVVDAYGERESYAAAVKWVSKFLRTANALAIVELHFNAYDGDALGFETLHWHTSAQGKLLAGHIHKELQVFVAAADLATKDRGVKARDQGSRGWRMLRDTPCACVLTEPFFGDNETEWGFWKDKQAALAEVYCRGIYNWLRA